MTKRSDALRSKIHLLLKFTQLIVHICGSMLIFSFEHDKLSSIGIFIMERELELDRSFYGAPFQWLVLFVL